MLENGLDYCQKMKASLDAALLGSNAKSCTKWCELLNGAEDYSACDLYLI